MIFSGLLIRLIFSVKTFVWPFFFIGLLGFLSMLIIGNLMYYTKQWGGGDTKIMMGIGAVFATVKGQDLFLLNLIINLLIVGAIYGLVWSVVLAIKNKDKFTKEVKRRFKQNKNVKFVLLILFIILTVNFFLIEDITTRIVVLAMITLVGLYYYLLIIIKAVEDSSMYKIIPVYKLTEGDWVANNVKINHKIIYKKSSLGVTKDQLRLIKNSKIKKIKIKEGIPFIPSIVLATLVTLVFGSLVSLII
tara:strand:+ start:11496 stop:12236 length:741 start_codon:yes stop_codon:yes gene_type:complete